MIRLGSPADFAVVREFLYREYSEDSNSLADRVGDFNPARHGAESALVRMFFLGRAALVSEWESAVPARIRPAFEALGLTEPASDDRIRSSVLLYRLYGLYICSDRFTDDEGKVHRPAEDCVYYALTETAHHYLYSLPKNRYEQVLEVGAGSGVAALMLARNSKHVHATDISSRCVLFTEFNRRLNSIENVTVLEGSLYQPVEGKRFDLIVCHPPFDISLSSSRYVYADGGEDGEFVTRGVISGLPEMLLPGGQLVAALRATDRTGSPLEARMRTWLGARQAEFDIALVVRSVITPQDHSISASMLSKQNLDDFDDYMDLLKKLDVIAMPYVHLLMERKATGAPLTLRRNMGKRCTAADMESLLHWERAKASADLDALRLGLSPHMELRVQHKLRDGELAPAQYTLVVEHPFHEEEPVPEWVARIAALFIRGRTTAEVYQLIREDYPIPSDDFQSTVKRLVSMGVLQPASGSSTISSI